MGDDPLNEPAAADTAVPQMAEDAGSADGAPPPDSGPEDADPRSPASPTPSPVIKLAALPTLSPPSAGGAQASVKGTPVGIGKSYSLDATRERIALFLLSILFLIILLQAAAGAIFAADCWNWNYCIRAKSAFDMIVGTMGPIFTAMVGLVGSVVGFYFGSQKQTA